MRTRRGRARARRPVARGRQPIRPKSLADHRRRLEAETRRPTRAEAEEAAPRLAAGRLKALADPSRATPARAPASAEAEVEAPEAAPSGGADEGGEPRAKPLWARFLAASLVIVVSMAAATSISLLVYLTDIAEGLSDNDKLASLREQLTEVDGGDPQTILILGSDKRLDTRGDPGRSDTTILLRVDPEQGRDRPALDPARPAGLGPGVGVDKFNAAYSGGRGGPELTLRWSSSSPGSTSTTSSTSTSPASPTR